MSNSKPKSKRLLSDTVHDEDAVCAPAQEKLAAEIQVSFQGPWTKKDMLAFNGYLVDAVGKYGDVKLIQVEPV